MKKYLALFLALFACHGAPSHSVGSTVIQPAATGNAVLPINLAGGSGVVTGALPLANQVSPLTQSSPVLIQPSAGVTTGSFDTTGVVLGTTASSDIGLRIAPLVGAETSYAGVWVGSAALSPSSGNYLFALSPSTLSYFSGGMQFGGVINTPGIVMSSGTIGATSGATVAWAATAGAIACGTGGTQTITAAQAATPGLTVTTGTLSSPCILDFSTNASTGFYIVDTSGVGTINVNNLEFKNGTQTQSLGALPAGGAVLVWTNGTNHIVVN